MKLTEDMEIQIRKIETVEFEDTDQTFTPHFHDYLVIGKIIEGKRKVRIADREMTAGPGDVLVFWPGMVHSCRSIDQLPLTYRAIELDVHTEKMQWISGSVLSDHELRQPVLSHEQPISSCFDRAFEMIESDEDKRKICNEIYILIRELFSDKDAFSIDVRQSDLNHPDETGSRQISSFMKNHLSEKLSLQNICEYFALSPSTLLRLFGRTFCQTPISHLESLRIQHVQHLLRNGIRPAEAAQSGGYYDQSHLCASFRKNIGQTPSAYAERKICLLADEETESDLLRPAIRENREKE